MLLSAISSGCRSSRPVTTFAQPALTTQRLNATQNSVAKTAIEKDGAVPTTKPANKVGLVSHQTLENEPVAKQIETSDAPTESTDKTPATYDSDETNAADVKETSSMTDDFDATTETDQSGNQQAESVQTGISLNAVLQSVADCYPKISIAISEIEAASGKTLASWG